MIDTGFTFRASWPILDVDRPLSALKAEACRDIDVMAHQAGGRIVGDITWTVYGERLIAEAPAVPVAEIVSGRVAWGGLRKHKERIEAMALRGMDDPTIASVIGCSRDAVRDIRREAGVRAA